MDNFNKGRRNFLKSAILGGCMLGASSIPFKKVLQTQIMKMITRKI